MQIRKNTKAYKSILRIVEDCHSRPDREKLVRLYITRAGHTLEQRISIEGIQGDANLLYDMTYQTVQNNLKSSSHQLHQSDDLPGIYFFHSTSNKQWDETPFEFDEAVLKLFDSLPEPPATRKKGKTEKFTLPTTPKPEHKSAVQPTAKKKTPEKRTPPTKKEEQQRNYRLKHKLLFTGLDKIIFRHPQTSKRHVLDYYDKVADNILPYLKDLPIVIYRHAGNGRLQEFANPASFAEDNVDLPDWIRTAGKGKEQLLLCDDRDHLFFYLEAGAIGFALMHAKTKSMDRPDYIVIALGADTEWPRVAEAALAAKSIFDGLGLPSMVKSDGSAGLHLYIPLDGTRDFQTTYRAAWFICRLLKLKAPDLIALPETNNGYRKVPVDYSLNEKGKSTIAPYSLAGPHPGVAVPLSWEDITPDLKLDQFSLETIMQMKRISDPNKPLSRKTDARALLKRLEEGYGFLLQ